MNQTTLYLLALAGVLLLAFVLRDLAQKGWTRPTGRLAKAGGFRSRVAAAWKVGGSTTGLGTGRPIACMVREAKGRPCTCAKPGCHGGRVE